MNQVELFISLNAFLAQFPPILWMSLSLLGTGWAVFALLFPSIILNPRLFYAVALTALVAGCFSRVIKVTVAAPRPPAILEPGSFYLLGDALHANAMPSGHTITAFAAVAVLVATSSPARRFKFALLFLLAVGAGLSRIAIGVHWVEDVAIGSIIGLISGFLGARLAWKLPRAILEPRCLWLKLLSAWGLVCIYVLLTQRLDFEENQAFQWALAVLVGTTFLIFWNRAVADGSAARVN